MEAFLVLSRKFTLPATVSSSMGDLLRHKIASQINGLCLAAQRLPHKIDVCTDKAEALPFGRARRLRLERACAQVMEARRGVRLT